ncbi:MAG: NADH-quinone oxidoreductase subunit NuoE [Thioalkalivibrionaceae bacterium]
MSQATTNAQPVQFVRRDERDEHSVIELSETIRHEIDEWMRRYPSDRKQSAVLGALRAVQHERHWLSKPAMNAVADYMGLPRMVVYEVASFYSMFETQPVGRHAISVCTNVSCMLRGSDAIVEYIEKKLGIRTGESTPDGKFFLKREEECLAACCGAPMMQVDHRYYEDLTPEKVDQILASFED